MDYEEFMMVDEVAKVLKISVSYAYKVIRKFNREMEKAGFFVIPGRVNREYFMERTCYRPSNNGKGVK